MSCYYAQKYNYSYKYMGLDGYPYTMFTLDMNTIIELFYKYYNTYPKTFFDCGCATGHQIAMAQQYDIDACGVDIEKYPNPHDVLIKKSDNNVKITTNFLNYFDYKYYPDFFNNGKIKIKSILDCEPINADIVYCNGILTYFTLEQLKSVIYKFHNAKLIIAIHNTTNDIIQAKQQHEILLTCKKLNIVKSNRWWVLFFLRNGFYATFNKQYNCFCAIPIKYIQHIK